MKIFLSIRPKGKGGGSNTFASLFAGFAKQAGHKIVRRIDQAKLAIVIAHLAEEADLRKARENGCLLLHRLDEYFESHESPARKAKHDKIIALNRLTDLTIYQSQFVFENVHPFLNPEKYKIIHNGGDPKLFHPAQQAGGYIGHVSWGIDTKKRLDLLHAFIIKHPEEKFLLVGRHQEHDLDFRGLANVTLAGEAKRKKLPAYYQKMKLLYFPSEKDPCPNTVIEAILSGVPVCYNPDGGTVELVRDCGLPLEQGRAMLKSLPAYREKCLQRPDLAFAAVFEKYLAAAHECGGCHD
ncbi:MAG: glycosyltransferase family 4 protein [Planctomycetes bacterium]|nr:glycosyltransferase family 4 protein [Planctomycetota bacterium]